MVDIESELFLRIVRTKSLPHPTARNFAPEAWMNAVRSMNEPSQRDRQLLEAALHFGHEIRNLRNTYEEGLFEGLSNRTSVLLTMAMANHNFLNLTRLAHENARKQLRKRDGPQSISSLANQPIPGPYPGNKATSDTAIATIVDTIPHCLERALRQPDEGEEIKEYWPRGSKLFAVFSVEHCLRDLWQSALWDAWALERDDPIRFVPTDIGLAIHWSAWQWRQEMLAIQRSLQDSIDIRISERSNHFAPPFQDPTVVGIGGRSKSDRRFRFGSVSGRERGQQWHVTENEVLEASYLAPFIDAPLPLLEGGMSCRELQAAWRILRDCATLLGSKCKDRSLPDTASLERYGLLIRRSEIVRAISHCAQMTSESANAAVQFFTCDLRNVGELFTKGLWARPLISIDSNESVLIALAAISVGSATRRIESWLDWGGLSDRLAGARRGLRYEAWVREELARRISENPLLTNVRCSKTGIDRRGEDGEQIDLLVQLGRLLIVGEVKCLLAPVESLERYNYLSNLNAAGAQAVKKASWLVANPEVTAEHFGITLAEAQSLRAIPLVVINQGAGLGWLAAGARVVDFQFLSLYLGEGSYHSGAAFNFLDKRTATQFQELYENEREAEANFEAVMADPPTLKRFVDAANWESTRFPMSDGRDLEIAICNFNDRHNRDVKNLISSVS